MPIGNLPRWLAIVPPLLILTVLAAVIYLLCEVRRVQNTLEVVEARLIDIDQDIHEVGGLSAEDEDNEYR